ncbi:MAG: sigma-70 family RNA polymerase sigma factor [Lachnospiraceae bacterium]|nr:sigma-70 family RNA polymerase sigma factor [Lachnospiraceae bacterium]
MRKKADGIEKYEGADIMQRITFLCDHYAVMESMISNFREELISDVMDQKASSHRGEEEGLGVRIQVAFYRNSDPTANQGISRSVIAKSIDEGYLDEDFFEGTEDREGLVRKITSYHMVNREYHRFANKLSEMDPRDRVVFLPYIKREKSLDDIAEELMIGYDSVVKRICRIKEKMRKCMDVKVG